MRAKESRIEEGDYETESFGCAGGNLCGSGFDLQVGGTAVVDRKTCVHAGRDPLRAAARVCARGGAAGGARRQSGRAQRRIHHPVEDAGWIPPIAALASAE